MLCSTELVSRMELRAHVQQSVCLPVHLSARLSVCLPVPSLSQVVLPSRSEVEGG